MPRISTYTKDATIVDEDILLGSNYVRTYNGIKEYNTRSFKLEDLATYFNTKYTTASIAANSITATELNISGNGSSGQFIMSDGDGSFSYLSILDEDNMSSNSATAPASQQSIKAYVDSQIATEDTIAELNDTTIGTLANAHLLIYDNDSSVWENKALSGDATITKEGVISLASSHTNIDSILNASLAVGRDADNQIKYSTDNQIIFRVDGGDNVVFKGSGEIEATSLDISGDADIDGTLEADAITVDGTTLSEYIADTAGAMFTSNTETFITATYDDSDNTIDLVVPVKDEDNMASDSASHLATQQSIKAYVDDKIQTQEEVEDIVGGMLDGTETFISVDYDDTDGNIDFVVPVKDEDNMTSNSATHLATQQSIKAYVDAQVDTEDTLAELDDTNISSAAAGQILVYDNTASVWDNVALTAGDLIDVTGGDGTLEIDVDLTEASEAAIANGDYMLFLDGGATGTPKKEALHDIATLFSGTGLTATNSVIAVDAAQTQITSVGTLNAGAISSGFGNIDNGSSTLNTGAATVDSLSVSDGNITNVGDIALDSISADGTTINVAMTDNTDGAFSVKQGSDKYIAIDTTDTGEDIAIGTGVSGTAITIGHTTSETTIQDNLTVTGNLKVNGDQVYQNVTSMAVTDPIISLQTGTDGANLGADSNKDVGLAMFWHNGSAAKTAFLGFDDSAGKLTFIPDASISSEVASGSVGIMVANLEGDVTGDVTGTATNASHVLVTDNESTNEENLITFVEDATSSTGNVGLEMDGNLTYNPSTGTVTATGFSGNLTGTLQTAAQANVTSLGTLTTLTVDNVIINATTIGHTSDTDLLTLASGELTIAGATNITGLLTCSATGDNTISTSSTAKLLIQSSGANGNDVHLGLKSSDTTWLLKTNRGDQISGNQGDFFIREDTAGVNALILETDNGNATFAGNVAVGFQSNKFIGSSAGNGLYFDGTGNYGMAVNSTLGLGLIFESDGGTAKDFFIGTGNSDPDSATKLLTITQAGDATFVGDVAINGALTSNIACTITGNSGYEDIMYIKAAGTNIDSRINLIPTGTGDGVVNATANDLILQTSGADRVTIADASTTFAGTVRMGTSTETANTNFDDLVIENVAGHSGITIFSKSDSDGAIYFGDVEANNLGQIKYLHGSNAMTFATNDGSASLTLDSGTDATFAGSIGVTGATPANGYSVEITPSGGNIIRSTRGSSVLAAYQSLNSHVYLGTTSNNQLILIQNDGAALTIDTSKNATFAGNIAVGGGALKTYHSNVTSVIELDDQASIFTRADETYIGQNIYYDSGDDGTAIEAGKGTLMRLRRGEINMYFSAASASSADDTHSLQEKFTLTDAGDLTLYGDVNVNLNDTAANFTIISASGQYDDSDDAKSVLELKYYGQGAFHTHRVGSSWQSIIENPNSGGSMEWWINGGQKLELDNSGNFGIGTGNPAAKLHAIQPAANYIAHFESTHANSYGVWIEAASSTNNGYPLLQVTPEGGSNPYFRVDSGTGHVGIGIAPTDGTLTVDDGVDGTFAAPQFRINGAASGYSASHYLDSDSYHIQTNSSIRDIEVIANTNGVVLSAGGTSWSAISDITLKENIKPLENVLDKIKDYQCVEYNFKNDDDKKKRIGLIAQDWEEDFSPVVNEKNGKLTMSYTETIPVLLKAIQELEARVKELENK